MDASTVNGRFESSPMSHTTRLVAGSLRASVVEVVGGAGGATVDDVVDPDPRGLEPREVVLVDGGAIDSGTDGGAVSSHSTITVCSMP